MSSVSEKLYQQAQLLPESVQLEVLHYMEYLSAKMPTFYGKTHELSHELNNEIQLQADENAHLDDESMPGYTLEERQQRQKKAHEILRKLATQPHCYQGIDVLAWQREQRQDRPMPFRNEE